MPPPRQATAHASAPDVMRRASRRRPRGLRQRAGPSPAAWQRTSGRPPRGAAARRAPSRSPLPPAWPVGRGEARRGEAGGWQVALRSTVATLQRAWPPSHPRRRGPQAAHLQALAVQLALGKALAHGVADAAHLRVGSMARAAESVSGMGQGGLDGASPGGRGRLRRAPNQPSWAAGGPTASPAPPGCAARCGPAWPAAPPATPAGPPAQPDRKGRGRGGG